VRGSLIDSNLWVALTFSGHPFHAEGQEMLSRFSKKNPANFCEATERSWLRLITTPAVQKSCQSKIVTNATALELRSLWMADPGIKFLNHEPEGTRELWHQLAGISSASPKVWMDAYLAAFAISGEMPFLTLDRDFQKYESKGLNLSLLC